MTAALAQGLIITLAVTGTALWYHRNVKDIRDELILAALISFSWVVMSGLYTYRDASYVLWGVNLFTFSAWTAGLVLLKEIHEALPKQHRFLITTILYVVVLLILEYVGYNIWMIQLDSNYTGLFGWELLHVPLFAKIYYLSIGPLYLSVAEYLRIR